MEFKQSQALLDRSKRVIPGGISSNVRSNWSPAPLFYTRGEGSHVWDADGNEFIDYVLGRGPMLLGHTPRPVIDAMKAQLELGMHFAGQTELEVEVAEQIVQLVPCAEMVRFNSTGSEAVHAALRLARAATGRKKIVRFEGHYHGWYENIAWNYAPPISESTPRYLPPHVPTSLGQTQEDGANLLIIPWNDLDLARELFEEHGAEIAGVITEAVMCNYGCIPPKPGYLQGLRRLCTENGSVLIFDEVITGFRLALGGAQEYFDVTPDLATFAKAIGAGSIVSAVAGKSEFMRRFGEMKTVHAGTYNANPVAMAGTKAALEILTANGGAELHKAHHTSEQLMTGIRGVATDMGVPIAVRGIPPVFSTTVLPEGSEEVVDYRTALQTDRERTQALWTALHDRGIRLTPEGTWFVSTAHTEADVEATLEKFSEAVESLNPAHTHV